MVEKLTKNQEEFPEGGHEEARTGPQDTDRNSIRVGSAKGNA